MTALHPAVAGHKAVKAVERRRADMAKRNAALAEARVRLDDQTRREQAAYDAALAAALDKDGPLPEPPRLPDGSAITRLMLDLASERDALFAAERAALRDHADEHWAALEKVEEALLAGLAPHAEAFVDALNEARQLQETAVRLHTAARPGQRPRLAPVDLARLFEVVLGGGRLTSAAPPAGGDFFATLSVSRVEG